MLYILSAEKISTQLSAMVKAFSEVFENISYVYETAMPSLKKNDCILFAWEADTCGMDKDIIQLIKKAYDISANYFVGAKAAIICYSESIYYTKSFSSQIAFLTNNMGLEFIGKPVAEATKDYTNYKNMQKLYDLPLEQICHNQCSLLAKRLKNYNITQTEIPKTITAVHASRPQTSNTYALMKKVLDKISTQKNIFSLAEKRIMDCRGCDFDQCMAFANNGRCYYEEDNLSDVFSSLETSGALMIACPNYNDSMPANYFAMINRMTYVYRTKSFLDKYIYAVIVSSNSGFDMVAMQIISAFCFNKGFRLPAYFALMQQANEPLSILKNENLEKITKKYALNIQMKLGI